MRYSLFLLFFNRTGSSFGRLVASYIRNDVTVEFSDPDFFVGGSLKFFVHLLLFTSYGLHLFGWTFGIRIPKLGFL
jgi:hypothetical protein